MSATVTTPPPPTAPSPADDSRVIIACALSSVAMVCLVAAMLYFRITVLRRERTLNEIRRLEALARRGENSRALSRTSSSASRLSLSKSWPPGSFRRQFSHPPRSPRSELRRGSLHTIPNGLGVRATVEPLSCRPSTADAAPTKPEGASSLPDEARQEPGVPRRASWSFDNPVFDQWVPPLTKPTDDDEEEEDVFSPNGTTADPENSSIALDSQLSGDGVALVATETDEDASSSGKDGGPRRHQKLARISGYSGSPLYLRRDDYPLSMPTLHEREDSSSSSGGNEKATEMETSPNGQPVTNGSRTRSESSC